MVAFADLLQHGNALAKSGVVRGRYAPSPTGALHLGNIRTALLAWLQVRLAGGVFILRMEDIDRPRTRAGSAEQILDDLKWLGLDWDEGPDTGGPVGSYTQSERDQIYQAAFAKLTLDGAVFPCFCSRRDIAEASSAPHGQTLVYPGTCSQLDEAGRVEMRAQRSGRHAAFRFRVGTQPDWVEFEDAVSGTKRQDLHADVGDFVVLRRDDLFAYQLAVVVDDALMGVTDVLRGADLLDSTPRQIRLFGALGATVPRFWHVPLMVDDAGERMSKRDGSESLASLRAAGATPQKVVGQLARSLGWDTPTAISARDLLDCVTLQDLRDLL